MTKAKLKLLIVEDNIAISKNIAAFMEKRSVELDFAYDGQLACDLALKEYFDCIVLDIAMPKMDGLQTCSILRERATRHIPILFLTARDSLDDKLAGFSHGADDYLAKPFALQELYARCQALAMRYGPSTAKVLTLGLGETEISLDVTRKKVTRAGQTIHLQPISFSILKLLMEAHPRAITRSEICDKLWHGEPTHSDALRSHLYQLRKAIDKPFAKPIVKTLHSVGFSLTL
ncbi:response regulator transcription factor [Microbulbifer sp. 2304DJ12-6]|uniref:response regulator transcription factor n=1 Tax=Microbulbifer sp. 2304DJ12-6 TaxID=3233340 RepID=UPI0039AFBA1C